MNRKKIYLIVQSALIVSLAVILAAIVIGIYQEGAAAKEEDVLVWIFSREKTAERLQPVLPLIFITAGAAAAGLILGVKDENGLGPVKGGMIRKPSSASASGGRAVRILLLIAAVCLLAAGVLNGSARDVFGKAVNICTECIGLG